MKKGLLKLLLPILVITLCLGGVSARALAAGGNEEQHITYEKTFSETVSGGGLAAYASPGPQFRTFSLGRFQNSYGDQLKGSERDTLAGTVYDKMVDYYVVDDNTGTLQFGNGIEGIEISFSDTGSSPEGTSSYAEAQKELSYIMTSAYGALLYDHPELFWIKEMAYSWTLSWTKTQNSFNAKISKVKVDFTETYSGAKQNITAFKAAVDNVVNVIKGKRTSTAPYQTLKAIHDYVCERITYPHGYSLSNPNPAYHSAAGMFLNVTGGVGVCECYAKSFAILCRKFNIPAILVVGDAGGAHMWNYVQLGGKWYVVDATWDDKEGTTPVDTYFLIGSQTQKNGNKLIASRTRSCQFVSLEADYSSKTYNYPSLSDTAYQSGTMEASMDEHNWEFVKTTQPTCTAVGVRIDQCTVCGDIRRTVTVAALGHSFQQQSRTEPTCTVPGAVVSVCSRCKIKQSTEIPALGHDFSGQEGVYNNDATTISDGTKTLTCKRGCGATMTVTAVGTKLSAVAAPAPAPAPAAPAAAAVSPAAAPAPTGLSPSSIKSLVLQGSQSTSVLKVGKTVAGDPIKRIESLNKNLVKVTSKGKIKALKKSGSAKLRITLASGATLTVKVKLQSGTVKTKKITGVPQTLTLSSGATAKLSPTLSPLTSQQKLSYSTSDKKVVTVTSSGRLKAKKKGKAVIFVKSGSKTVKCTVTVN